MLIPECKLCPIKLLFPVCFLFNYDYFKNELILYVYPFPSFYL